MNGRVALGAVVGGIVLFLWGFASHVMLPLGDVGIREIAGEEPVLAAMRENIPEQGLYFFPGIGKPHGEATDEDWTRWNEKAKAGPIGFMVYNPRLEGEMMSPGQLGTELVNDVLLALIAAMLLAMAAGSLAGFGARYALTLLLGAFGALVTNVPYWNWYGFPGSYTVAQLADEMKKRSYIEKYIPHIGRALQDILALSDRLRDRAVTNLKDVLEKSRRL